MNYARHWLRSRARPPTSPAPGTGTVNLNRYDWRNPGSHRPLEPPGRESPGRDPARNRTPGGQARLDRCWRLGSYHGSDIESGPPGAKSKCKLPKSYPRPARFHFDATSVNLLLNAAIHTPPGTAIGIEARQRDNFLELMVTDNGAGLSQELCPKCSINSSSAVGWLVRGLGLAIVKGFIEAQAAR